MKNPSFRENPPTDKAALDGQTERVNKASLMFNSKKPETDVQLIGVEQKARITNKQRCSVAKMSLVYTEKGFCVANTYLKQINKN